MNTVLTRQQRNWWNTVVIGVVAVIAFLMIWLSACSSTSSTTTNIRKAARTDSAPAATPGSASASKPAGESVPKALADAGEYGENVYDYAKANDWKNVDVKVAALRDAVKTVRTDGKIKSAAVDRLDGNVAALDRAVTAKDRQAAMREANQVTLDVADMTTVYKLSVPVEVTRLDYYGRELEVWAQAQDTNKLQATAAEMRRTWDSLRPSVDAQSATEAKKFGALVAQVESAKRPADYTRVATLVLNEVDNLEKLFH
jgi:PBP1b-binding outer membrane lipoprotein LpoB